MTKLGQGVGIRAHYPITWKKGQGKQYNLPNDIKAVGKDIKWAREDRGLKIWGRKSRFKQWGWGRIWSCRELNTPLFKGERQPAGGEGRQSGGGQVFPTVHGLGLPARTRREPDTRDTEVNTKVTAPDHMSQYKMAKINLNTVIFETKTSFISFITVKKSWIFLNFSNFYSGCGFGFKYLTEI